MGHHGSKRLDHTSEIEAETAMTDTGEPTVKTVLIIAVEQSNADIAEKIRVSLSDESRLSVYDTTDGKLETLLTNANAIILVCSENLESYLGISQKVTMTILETQVEIDCGVLKKYIDDGSKKEKFIAFARNASHIPVAIQSNFKYICSDESDIDTGDFLSTVRPQIESL